MTTTTIASPALAAGIPFSERTRLVALADPHLVETLERASQEYHRHEDAWQQEAARHQRNAGMPKRRLESPHGRALREVATAVVDAFDELVASGQIEAKN